ncbi:carboxylating nicotinate-nucleotide diphosphorylase [Candidatus Woesearchaeota archaeon]|nr:carboxylating nicotinate-nucleotide diphosphorylase [Candidatus Woesearchaeota archaeon]
MADHELEERLITKIIALALEEDIGSGDVTTASVITTSERRAATILLNEAGVVCGLPLLSTIFRGDPVEFHLHVKEGYLAQKGTDIVTLKGPAPIILTKERTLMNFLQVLSGIATQTHAFVELVKNYPVTVLDTRKTHPGLRMLEKYAVCIGGAKNHRFGLYDMVLIKDNHLKANGSLTDAVNAVVTHHRKHHRAYTLEVEVANLDQVKEALRTKADLIMLDNMSLPEIKQAVSLIQKKKKIEVSGGVTLQNIRKIAACGVDYISIGSALTLGAKPLDMSLDFSS